MHTRKKRIIWSVCGIAVCLIVLLAGFLIYQQHKRQSAENQIEPYMNIYEDYVVVYQGHGTSEQNELTFVMEHSAGPTRVQLSLSVKADNSETWFPSGDKFSVALDDTNRSATFDLPQSGEYRVEAKLLEGGSGTVGFKIQ